MRPFDFRAKFTGICATVPNNSDLGSATEARVVMPGAPLASGERQNSLDKVGPPLCPHQALVWFSLANTGEEAADVGVKLPLNRRRLTFAFEEDQPELNDFEIVTTGSEDIRHLLQLEFAAPRHCLIDPACLDDPPTSIVQSQAVITRGRLRSEDALNPWRFPGTLGGASMRRYCARYAILEVRQVTELTLKAESFDGEKCETVSLYPAADESEVEVTISNSCIDYPDPPSWMRGNGYETLPDEDFRWYYELLPRPTRKAILAKLDGLPLPFPYPVPIEHFIKYGNCWPVLAFAAPPPKG